VLINEIGLVSNTDQKCHSNEWL